MDIYLCEDDNAQLKRLQKIINNYLLIENLDMQIVQATADPQEILKTLKLNNSTPNIYFLDIDLQTQLNGLELAAEIRKFDSLGTIVFVTTHDELARETFKYQVAALDFIVKDNPQQLQHDVIQILIKVQEQLQQQQQQRKLLVVKTTDQVLYLDCQQIEFIETLGDHKLLIHEINKQQTINSDLKDLEQRLPTNFLRIHKSFIINTDFLLEFNKKQKVVVLQNGITCPVSRRKVKTLENLLAANEVE